METKPIPSGPVDRLVRGLRPILRILVTPSCWTRNYQTCPHMTRFINAALDRGDTPKRIDAHYVELSGRRFWAANYPYAYAHDLNGMPDRATVFRLSDAVGVADWSLPPNTALSRPPTAPDQRDKPSGSA